MIKKFVFVSSEKPEAKTALKKLKTRYENVKPNEADVIVALGGETEQY